MATLARNPLATKPFTNHLSTPAGSWPASLRKSSSAKRARSPEPGDSQVAKRTKALTDASRSSLLMRDDSRRRDVKETKEDRLRKRMEEKEEFRVKYTRAFPSWKFYFDLEGSDTETVGLRKELQAMVVHMGASVEDFFAKEVTHLIVMEYDDNLNKENLKARISQSSAAALLSPIKLKNRPPPETPVSELVKRAQEFEMKIWSVEKLRSVLERCYPHPAVPSTSTLAAPRATFSNKERSLSRLLENERLHGTTERDPTQKRHDYVYFSKNSYFVLVEDMRQELATIIALEYPISRSRDGKEKGSWPVLHCHPLARGPFHEYDEKEQARQEKAELQAKEHEQELERRRAKLREQERRRRAEAQRKGDLRRTVSMHNMRRRATLGGGEVPERFVDLDADDGDIASAEASGYLGSGNYLAASGNSVGITSATGTTSTAGLAIRTLQLPQALRGKLQQQVVTSRRLTFPTPTIGKENPMGPPSTIPDRPQRLLRKSRSTNTMRLPKRDEGVKPGYCESCRVRFEDFKQHVQSRKHRKFAEDDDNFAALDDVLSRVRRRTIEEVRAEREGWHQDVDDFDEENAAEPDEDPIIPQVKAEDDIQWDDWVAANAT